MADKNMSKLRRYQMVIYTTMFVGYAIYAYNRKSVSFALPKLMEEGLDKRDAGAIISSQNVAYAISKFLGGILSDRMSSRLLFSTGLLLSGVATLLFAGANSLIAYTALWFLNGFAQGCGWPACAKVLRQFWEFCGAVMEEQGERFHQDIKETEKRYRGRWDINMMGDYCWSLHREFPKASHKRKWFEPERFGTFWSLLSASANISGGVAPFISAYLVISYGWRFSLIVAGSVSIVLGSLSLLSIVDKPEQVGLQSFSQGTSAKGGSKGQSGRDKSNSWDLVTSPFLWLVSFCYMVVFCAKTSAVDWGQLYLIEDKGHSPYVGSAFTSSVESGGFVGGVLAGYMTDWVLKRKSNSQGEDFSNPRMPVAMLFMVGVMTCLHLLCFNVHNTSPQWWMASLGFVLGACLYGPIAIFGVVASESAPAHLSGTAHAVVALAANVGAVSSGLPFTILAKRYSWRSVFLFLELLCGGTALVMIFTTKTDSRIGRKKQD